MPDAPATVTPRVVADAPLVVLHGGAGRIEAARRPAYRDGLRDALAAAWRTVDAGGTAVDAALAAVEAMERNPRAFNAGIGAAPTRDGRVECDAAVATWTAAGQPPTTAGAVGALEGCRAPCRAADRVRRESDHVLIVGPAADAWIPDAFRCAPDALLTEASRERLARWKTDRATDPSTVARGSATVGAVVRDARGDLAAVTSTGGRLGQEPGRVGDTPILGAGTLADAGVAVSCTGKGEAFLLRSTAKALAEALGRDARGEGAVRRCFDELAEVGGDGGLICLTADGRAFVGFTTPHMAWAAKGVGLDAARLPGSVPGVDVAPKVLRLA